MIARAVVALLSGLLFGVGLGVSRMTDPAQVLAFLDLAGAWDPSLVLVMAGAILTHGVACRVVQRWGRPLAAARFVVPASGPVDATTLVGAAVFGVGWGLVGYCPGPAFASLGGPAAGPAALALVAMALGGHLAGVWRAGAASKGQAGVSTDCGAST